jgi:hypothetical protein
LNPIPLLSETNIDLQRKTLPCGRICEEHIREARLIQSSLIPTASLRDYSVEIAFRFIPFFDVGGDFLDFFHLPDGLIGLYIGDVVGKGLPATMYGALVMGILRGIHKSSIDTGTVLSILNQRLLQRPLPNAFARPSTPSSILPHAPWPFPMQDFHSLFTPVLSANRSARAGSLRACFPAPPMTST